MPTQTSIRQNKRFAIIFGSIDIIATILTLLTASWITNNYTQEKVVFDQEFLLITLVVLITWVILLKATHLARIPRTSAIPIILGDFFRLSLIGGIILLLLDWTINLDSFPALALAIFIALNFFSLFLIRYITFKFFKKFRANEYNIRNIVIIANDGTDFIIDKLLYEKEWGFNVLHIITDSASIREKYESKVKTYSKNANIKSLLRYDIVDELICCDCDLPENRFTELIEYCQNLGVTLRLQGNLPIPGKNKGRIQYFDRIPFVTIENSPIVKFSHIVKAISEIIIAFSLLIIFSPFLAILSFFILATSRGPIVYKQERVGLRGRKFHIFKFRTTYFVSSKNSFAQKNETDSELKEPNYTPIGKIICKFKLDFIPQFLNVIKGEMALIGPKAPTPEEAENYQDWQMKLLSVKPGITCTWQIAPDRDVNKNESGMKMDIHYIENWNLKSDIALLLKTLKALIISK
jgi:lipopolysaccharide/colanic/teichoic acid biosynthesis glycosyltransferase